jgi:hypothetical protein
MEGHDREQPQAATKAFCSPSWPLSAGASASHLQWLISSAGMDPVTSTSSGPDARPAHLGYLALLRKGTPEAKNSSPGAMKPAGGQRGFRGEKPLPCGVSASFWQGIVGFLWEACSSRSRCGRRRCRGDTHHRHEPVSDGPLFLLRPAGAHPGRAVAGIAFIVGGSAAIGM